MAVSLMPVLPRLSFGWLCLLLFVSGPSTGLAKPADGPKVWTPTPDEVRTMGLQTLTLGGQSIRPRHDGVHYFIDTSDSPVDANDVPAVSDIEAAVSKARTVTVPKNTDIGGSFLAQSLMSLPLTIGVSQGAGMKEGEQVTYGITLMAMTFRPSGVLLTVGLKFLLPGQSDGQPQYLYLGAKNLAIPYQGGTLSGDLILIEAGNLFKNVYLGDKIFFELGSGTAIGFDCGKLKHFHLNGRITLPQDMLVPESSEGEPLSGRVSFLFNVDIQDWDNVFIGLTLPMGFRLPVNSRSPDDLLAIGFQPENKTYDPEHPNIILDLSRYQDPPTLQTISCFRGVQGWRGIFIEGITLRLPPLFSKSGSSEPLYVGVKDLAISDAGFFASVSLTNLLPIEQGRIGDGFDISVDRLSLSICNTSVTLFDIAGDLRLPIMSRNEALTYSYFTSDNYPFQVSIGYKNNKQGITFDAFGAKATLCQVFGTLTKVNGKTQLSVNLSGGLTMQNPTNKLDLSFAFQGLKVTSTAPFISDFKLIVGNTISCQKNGEVAVGGAGAISLSVAGMELSLGNLAVSMQGSTGLLQASAAVSLNLDNKISATGFFVAAGQLKRDDNGRFYFANTRLGVDGICVQGDFNSFSFGGCVEIINSPALGVGYAGQIGFKLNLKDTGAGGTVDAIFAKKDNFKYWFLDLSFELSPAIPLIGPLSLRGMNGAAYKNVSFQYADAAQSQIPGGKTPSGLVFTPKEGAWGLRAGMMLSVEADGKSIATVGAMLELVGQKNYGIKKVSLFGDLQLVLPNQQTPTLAGVRQKMGVISAALDQYLDQETLGQNTSVSGDNFKGAANANKAVTTAATGKIDFFNNQAFRSQGNRIGANVLISYRVDKKELIGLVYPDINVKVDAGFADLSTKSTGYGIFYFGPKDWYIHLGKQNWDDRLGVIFKAESGPLKVSSSINGYFMLGSGIEELPPPQIPGEFASLFESQTTKATLDTRKSIYQDYAAVKSGKGMAAGLATAMRVKFSIAGNLMDINLAAGAGIDVVFSDNPTCPDQVGISDRKFAALGQLYGYASGDLSIKGVTLAGLGLGFSLKAAVPKPFMAEGQVLVYAKIWFAKAKFRVKVSVGNMCDVEPPKGPAIVYNFLEGTAPANKATGISPLTNLNVFYSDTIRTYTGNPNINVQTSVKLYDPAGVLVYSDSKTTATSSMGLASQSLVPFEITRKLAPNTLFKVLIASALLEDSSPVNDDMGNPIAKVDTITFTTGGNVLRIEPADLATYPLPDQYNVYRNDWDGLLKVNAAVVIKLKSVCPACTYYASLRSAGSTRRIDMADLTKSTYSLSDLGPATTYTFQLLTDNSPSGTQVVYEGHSFRTSSYGTFAEKLQAYDGQKTTEVVSPFGGTPVINLSLSTLTSDPAFEPFSKEEIADYIITNPLQPATGNTRGWFALFDQAIALIDEVRSTYWTSHKQSINYQQQSQPYLSQGSSQRYDTGAGETGPRWTLALFEPAIYDFADEKAAGTLQDNNAMIPVFEGSYRLPLVYNPVDKHPILKGSFPSKTGYLTFAPPSPIDLNQQTLEQYIIDVACQPSAIDREPVTFSVRVLNRDGVPTSTLADGLSLTVYYPDIKGQPKSNRIPIPARESTITYTSDFASQYGCPVGNQKYGLQMQDARKPFLAKKYALQISNKLRPDFKPYISTKCISIATPMPNDFDSETDQLLVASGDRTTFSGNRDFQAYQYSYFVEVKVYENASLLNLQTVKVPTTIALSNGRSFLIPQGANGYQLELTPDEAQGCLTLGIQQDSTLSGGTNEDAQKTTRLYGVAVTNTLTSLETVCSATTDRRFYTLSLPLAVGSQLRADSSQTGLSAGDGYYGWKTDQGTVNWVYAKNGQITQTGSCSDSPYIKQVCIPNKNYTPTSAGSPFQLLLTLYTSNTQSKRFIPNYPIRVTLTNGQEYSIPVGTDKDVLIDLSGNTCAYITSVFPDSPITYNQISVPTCDNPAAAPVVTGAPAGPVSFGQPITLTVAGCSGSSVIWQGINASGSSTTFTPKADMQLRVQCLQGGCPSKPALIEIKLAPFSVSSNVPANQMCRRRAAVLMLSGCAGTVSWMPGNLTGSSITVSPLQTTTYTMVCLLPDGTSRPGDPITISVLDTPDAPTISSSVPSSRQNQVCLTDNAVTLSASACGLGSLYWYAAADKATPAQLAGADGQSSLTVRPTATTTYYAVCRTSTCESDPSDAVSITVINPPVPTIKTEAFLNTICRGFSTQLTAAGCPYTVVWSDGQSGNQITVSPQTTRTYTATCQKEGWCSGLASGGLLIKVVDQASLAAPILTASSSEFCSYQSATVSVTGTYTGRIEWTTPANTDWHAEGDNLTSLTAQHPAGSYGYQVRSTLNGCTVDSRAVTLTINPKPAAPTVDSDKKNHTICAGDVINLSASCSLGSPVWENLSSTKLTGLSVGTHTYTVYCKSAKNCDSDKASLVVTVNPVPQPPTIVSSLGNPICAYDATTLSAIGCSAGGESGSISWRHNPGLGGSIGPLNQSGTFAANCTVKGCVSSYSGDLTLTVNPKPQAPTLGRSAASVCSDNDRNITFTASGSNGTYRWSDGNDARGSTLTVSAVGQYSYSVKAIESNCVSDASAAQTAEIYPTPAKCVIQASQSGICTGQEVTLWVDNCAGTVRWVSEGNETGNRITKTLTATHEFLAECVSDKECVGAREKKSITVYPYPPVPALTVSQASICSGNDNRITFTATDGRGTYVWSDGNNSRGATLTVSAAGQYSYSVQCIENGCSSGFSPTRQATITPTAGAITLTSNKTNNTICADDAIILTASGCGGTVYWQDGNTGASRTFSPGSETTYSAQCKQNGYCDGAVSSLRVTVNSRPGKPTISGTNWYCAGGSVTLTVQDNPGNDTPAWSTGNTGSTLTAMEGSYTVYLDRAGCAGLLSDRFTVTRRDKPTAPGFSPSNPSACPGSTVTITATDDGLFTTGASTVAGSPETTYYATRTVNGCTSDQASVRVSTTYSPEAPAISVGNIDLIEGNTGTLTASGCTNGTVSWENGTRGVTLSVTNAGTYKATCTISTDCGDKQSTASGTVFGKQPPAAGFEYTGKWLLCDGEGATARSFAGCSGTVAVYKDNTLYTNTYLEVAQNYYALCREGGQIAKRTTFSISAGSRPTRLSVGKDPNVSSIVSGNSIALTAQATGANSYRWTSGETSQAITVSPTTTTTYSFVAYSGSKRDGCESSGQGQTTISVTPPCTTPTAPTLSADKETIVQQGSVELTASGCNYTVVWSDGATGATRLVRLDNSTGYTAICQNGNCTSGTSNRISITVMPFVGKFSMAFGSKPSCDEDTPQNVYSLSGDIQRGAILYINADSTLPAGWYTVYTDNAYYTVSVGDQGKVMSRNVCKK